MTSGAPGSTAITTTPEAVTKTSRYSTISGVSATPWLMSNAVAAMNSNTSDEQLGHLVADVGDDLLVDPAADLDGVHERAEVVVGEDHPAGLLGDLAAAAHRHADVGLLQRGGVVDGVAGHRHDQPLLLHQPGEAELVLRRDPAEDVQLGEPARRAPRRVSACSSVPLIAPGPEPERLADRLGGDGVVAGDHAHVDARRRAPSATAAFAVGAQRVDDPDHADEREVVRERHRVGGHRVELVVVDEAGREGEHAQALLAHALVRRVDARRAPRSIGTCEPLIGPPDEAAARQHDVGAALDQLDHALVAVHRVRGGRWP